MDSPHNNNSLELIDGGCH
jgi:hypothetical protein